MTIQELEQHLLRLSPADQLHIIQLLAHSLNTLWPKSPQPLPSQLSEIFRQAPSVELTSQPSILTHPPQPINFPIVQAILGTGSPASQTLIEDRR